MRENTCCFTAEEMLLVNCRRFTHLLWRSASQFTFCLRLLDCSACPPFWGTTVASSSTKPRQAFCSQSLTFVRCNSTLVRRSRLISQHDKIKQQYKDYILLFQVGDFYELYGEDASKIAWGGAKDTTCMYCSLFMCVLFR